MSQARQRMPSWFVRDSNHNIGGSGAVNQLVQTIEPADNGHGIHLRMNCHRSVGQSPESPEPSGLFCLVEPSMVTTPSSKSDSSFPSVIPTEFFRNPFNRQLQAASPGVVMRIFA